MGATKFHSSLASVIIFNSGFSMQKWEYKVVTIDVKRNFRTNSFDSNAIEEELNKYGLQGWELAAAEAMASYPAVPPVLIFKRVL